MQSIAQKRAKGVTLSRQSMAKALRSHARSQMTTRIDAKSILLVNEAGKVQEPTNTTLNLLGARSSAARHRQVTGASVRKNDKV